jgi:hypothetical protein
LSLPMAELAQLGPHTHCPLCISYVVSGVLHSMEFCIAFATALCRRSSVLSTFLFGKHTVSATGKNILSNSIHWMAFCIELVYIR